MLYGYREFQFQDPQGFPLSKFYCTYNDITVNQLLFATTLSQFTQYKLVRGDIFL